jgi:MFS family permease
MVSNNNNNINTPMSSLRNYYTPQTTTPFYIEEEEEPPSNKSHHHHHHQYQYLYVLPVLLLEFLAVALTRAVLPSLLLEKYGKSVYLVLGVADCVRGLLAFAACPIFGKLSDIIGRRVCLFVTVLGTCAPVCSLAFFKWDEGFFEQEDNNGEWGNNTTMSSSYMGGADDSSSISISNNSTAYNVDATSAAKELMTTITRTSTTKVHPHAITSFVILLALSGVFSSTFTLIFAYISDTVRRQDERVSAYGLALATFGLSFTIGTS